LDPLIKSEKDKNSQNIQDFEDTLKNELNKMRDEPYTKYETGTTAAYEGLEQFEVKLGRLSKELEHFQVLANGFDDENATNGCRNLQEKMTTQYTSMRELWDHIKLTLTRFNEIYTMNFAEANTEAIDDT
jgi:archaellum component FlaC